MAKGLFMRHCSSVATRKQGLGMKGKHQDSALFFMRWSVEAVPGLPQELIILGVHNRSLAGCRYFDTPCNLHFPVSQNIKPELCSHEVL